MPGLHYCTAHGALYGYSTACTVLGAAAGKNERRFYVCDEDNDIYRDSLERPPIFSFLSCLNSSFVLACSLWIVETDEYHLYHITVFKLRFT